jgi:SAM-dependent methyltransferase
METVNWSELMALRHSPIEEQYINSTAKKIASNLAKGRSKLLDFGSGPGWLSDELKLSNFQGTYESLDIDPLVPATYRDLEELPYGFDIVCLLEVVEHCTLAQSLSFFEKFHEILLPGGLLVMSTPDPSHPTWIREDITHRQHYPIRDTAALLRMIGFENPKVLRIADARPRPSGVLSLAVRNIGHLHSEYLTRMTGVNFRSRAYVLTVEKSHDSERP